VYDMYPWPQEERSGGQPSRDRGVRPPGLALATQAVQVALDRRDNGGDAAAEPTAGLARQ
jgi:hypothetical protein